MPFRIPRTLLLTEGDGYLWQGNRPLPGAVHTLRMLEVWTTGEGEPVGVQATSYPPGEGGEIGGFFLSPETMDDLCHAWQEVRNGE
jgi:hypothetical protein